MIFKYGYESEAQIVESESLLLINSNLSQLDIQEAKADLNAYSIETTIIGGGLESASGNILAKIWEGIKGFFTKLIDYFFRFIEFILGIFGVKTKQVVNNTKETVKRAKDKAKEEKVKPKYIKVKLRRMSQPLLDKLDKFISEAVQNKARIEDFGKEYTKVIQDSKIDFVEYKPFREYLDSILALYRTACGVYSLIIHGKLVKDEEGYTKPLLDTMAYYPNANKSNLSQRSFPAFDTIIESTKNKDSGINFAKPYIDFGKYELDYFEISLDITKPDKEIENYMLDKIKANKFNLAEDYIKKVKNTFRSMNNVIKSNQEDIDKAIKNATETRVQAPSTKYVPGGEGGDFIFVSRMATHCIKATKVLIQGFNHALNQVTKTISSISQSVKDAQLEVENERGGNTNA